MKKTLLTLLLLLSFGFVAGATEQAFKVASSSLTTNDDITISIAKANGSTAPRWDPTYVRAYNKNTITVKGAAGVTITKVVFGTESSNGTFLSGASVTNGTFNASQKTWTGSAQEFVLTNGNGTSGHTRINTFTVTYTKAGLTECPAPEFNVNDGAEVFPGQEIIVNKKDATSVVLYVNEAAVAGESYVVPEDAEIGSTIALRAESTLEGEGVTVPNNSASITVTVAEQKGYYLLTDIKDLYDGAQGYIVCTSKNMIMGAQNAGSYREKINLSNDAIADGVLSVVPENAALVTFVKSADKYMLKVADGYLNLASDNNQVKTQTAEATATITLSGSDAQIEFTAQTGRYLEYNASSPRFACYKGTQEKVQIYILPRPAAKIVDFTHEFSHKARVATLNYVLHVNNHADDTEYTVTLNFTPTAGGETITETNEVHTLVAPEAAAAPARAAEATHKLSGTVGTESLTPATEYNVHVTYAVKGSTAEPVKLELPKFTTLTTGIEDVTVEGTDAPAEYFNLQGVRVAQPEAGNIYIVRRGAKVTKELVK